MNEITYLTEYTTITVVTLEELTGHPPPFAPIIHISPNVAAWVLEHRNPYNRPVKPRIQNQIKRQGYEFIGGIILFGITGMLIDGQNRLIVCRDEGITIKTYVGFGIPDGAFTRIDSGVKRTGADVFAIAHIQPSKTIAEATRWLMNDERARLRDLGFCRDVYDSETLMEFFKEKVNKDRLVRQASFANKHVRSGIPPGQLAAQLYLYETAGFRERVSQFKRELDEGHRRGGAYQLSKRIRDIKDMRHRVPEMFTIAWIRQAINGDKISWSPEKFDVVPEIGDANG